MMSLFKKVNQSRVNTIIAGVRNLQKLMKKKVYYALAAGIILIGLVGVGLKATSSLSTISENVPLVKTSVVQAGAANDSHTYSGEVRGRYESQLAFQVGGKIVKRNVDLGSVVHAGDVLMQIDAKDIQQTVNMGAAQVAAAESQLNLAASNLKRYRQLYEEGLTSRASYEQYQSDYDSAAATVQQAEAHYAQGANQLDYSALYADSNGVVTEIAADAGQVVGAGQRVITVVKSGEQEVEINVPENRVEDMRKASQLKVTFWALPGVTLDGNIREIAPIADKVTRTYKVRVTLINPPPELKLGMTASVSGAGLAATQAAMNIPLAAVYQTTDTPSVWVVAGDTVHLRPVKLGAYGNDQVEVLEGLSQGDVIVVAGVHKLREDQQVRAIGGEGQ